MESKTPHKRKLSPLVDHRTQLYISLQLVLYLVVYTVILLVIILIPSAVKFMNHSLPLEEQLEASREFLFLDARVVPVVLVLALLMGLHFLFITRRIFGPLKRLSRTLRAWEAGIPPGPFEGRKKDFHAGLFEAFNAVVETVGSDVEKSCRLITAAAEKEGEPAGDAAAGEGGRKESEKKLLEAIEILKKYAPLERDGS